MKHINDVVRFGSDHYRDLTIINHEDIAKQLHDGQLEATDDDLIKLSIKKWLIVAYQAMIGQTVGCGGRWSCALCLKYNYVYCCGFKRDPKQTRLSKKCPVYKRTGYYGCENTPYDEYQSARVDSNLGINNSGAFRVAKAEIRFLRSLLKGE